MSPNLNVGDSACYSAPRAYGDEPSDGILPSRVLNRSPRLRG